MPFLPPNQQCQSTEGNHLNCQMWDYIRLTSSYVVVCLCAPGCPLVIQSSVESVLAERYGEEVVQVLVTEDTAL